MITISWKKVRGLKALQCFTPETPNLSLKDVSERLGITRSAAFRTVYTLAEMGCLIPQFVEGRVQGWIRRAER